MRLTIPLALAVAATAEAAPRRVAVVNAAQDGDQQAGAELAARLRTVLALEPMVTPIPPGDLARALEGALAAPAHTNLAGIADLLARAREDMAQFDYQSSLARLAQAEQDLLAAWPSPESARLLAEIVLDRGHIYMRQRQRERAVQEFMLAHRLDPERQLEPEQYLPDVIEAFAEAETRDRDAEHQVALEVSALLDGASVYLDGRFAGYTPLTTRVAAGAHYVAGTFAGQAADGQRIIADAARGRVVVKLGLGSASVDERALHWRQRYVSREPAPLDPGLATELGRGAAEFTGAEATLVIATGVDGELHIASYDARTRTAGDWTSATEEGIEQVLAPFADTGPQLLASPSMPPELLEHPARHDNPPWYRRPFYRGLVNSGIAVSVAAVVFYAVLQGSNTIGGSCCTLGVIDGVIGGFGDGGRHRFSGLGFSF